MRMAEWKIYRTKKKRGKVRWNQNLYYLPSLGESSRGTVPDTTRIRFNYLYFVIVRRVKRGFLSRSREIKMASGPEFTFLWIILLTKKKNRKRGKKTVFICKGSPTKTVQLLWFFFSHTPLFKDVQPVDSRIRIKINIEWHNV